MINLLPGSAKSELRAAHGNVTLLKYIFALGLGIAFLCFISVGVYFILMDIKATANNAVDINQQKSSSYGNAQSQAATLRDSLSDAKNILDNEVRYSKLLTSIASLMPTGTAIDSLNLNATLFDAPTTLSIYAKSIDVVSKLKDNFQSSNLFTNVSFQSIANSSQGQASDYPITAVVNLTIRKSSVK